MNRIIALSGHSKSGKSTSLLYLIEYIRAELENHDPYPIGRKDRRELFVYRGKRIFICTMGDSCSIVETNFAQAQECEADILVTATRTTRGSYRVVAKHADDLGFCVENYCKARQYNMTLNIKLLACKKTAEVILEALNE